MSITETNTTPLSQTVRRDVKAALLPSLIVFSMGQTVLFAIAGPVVRDLGLTEFQFGVIVSAAALMFVIGAPFWGRVSDSVGRKRIIVSGMTIYGIASFVFVLILDIGLTGALSPTFLFLSLLCIRLAYAIFGSGIQPCAIALMSSMSSNETRTSAIAGVSAAMGIGMVLGPACAVIFAPLGPLMALYVIAAMALTAALAMLLQLDEPATSSKVPIFSGALEWRGLFPLLILALLLFTAASAIQQTVAFYLQDLLQLSTADTIQTSGGFFLVMACVNIVTQGIIIRRNTLSPMQMLVPGLALMMIGSICYAISGNYLQLMISSGIIGAALGLLHPGLLAAASLRTSDQTQGAVAGAMQAMIALGFVLGPLLGTALYAISPVLTTMLIIFCIGGMTAIGFVCWFNDKDLHSCS